MSAASQAPQRYTLEDYLHLEAQGSEPLEYYDGAIIPWDPTPGPIVEHGYIRSNISHALEKSCRAKGLAGGSLFWVKLAIPSANTYCCPDSMLICSDPTYDDALPDAITNPTLVVEVISDSSRAMDYGDKVLLYAKVEAIRGYVIVEQKTPFMPVHSLDKGNESFTSVEYDDLEAVVRFPSIDAEIVLGEFYRDIVWTFDRPKLQLGAGIPLQPGDDFGAQDAQQT